MEELKKYLGQLFENRSNCYADVDNDEVIMAMDKQQFVDTVIEYLEQVRDGEISHENSGLNKPVVTNHVCHTCKGTGLVYIDDVIKNTLCPDC